MFHVRERGFVLILVVIMGLILSLAGIGIVYLMGQQQIAAHRELHEYRANMVADAGIEWGKVWISSACIDRYKFPENVSGNRNFFEIARQACGDNGSFVVGIMPDGSNAGTVDIAYTSNSICGAYVIVATATISSGITGTLDTIKRKSIRLTMGCGFSPTGSMSVGRLDYISVLLPNGKVLIAGGYTGSTSNKTYLSSAELYDPTTGRFTATGSMTTKRRNARGIVLPMLGKQGKVLVFGGNNGANTGSTGHALRTAELYDIETGVFTSTNSMNTARFNPYCIKLSPTTFLIYAGYDLYNHTIATAEIYDATKGRFTLTGSMNKSRIICRSCRLSSNKVLVVGGSNVTSSATTVLSSAEIYDPATGVFTYTSKSMSTPRSGAMATLIPANGTMTEKFLIAGGIGSNGGYLSSAELFDPGTDPVTNGRFILTGNMMTSRQGGIALWLSPPVGKVMFIGGLDADGNALSSAEYYDPRTGIFGAALGGKMTAGRYSPSVTPLGNGTLLITGGQDSAGKCLATAELYNTLQATCVKNSYAESAIMRKRR